MKRYAYIRVSTKEQNVDRQILALEPYHLSKKDIYCDYQSGKDFERPAYRKLLKKLKEGDLLIVKSIDRLGRNYNDILIQWQYITKEIKADIVVLDMELLDTRQKAGNLTGTLIADLVLQIFAYVAHRPNGNLSASGRQKGLQQPKEKERNSADQKKKCQMNLKKFAGGVNRENCQSDRRQNYWE